MEFRGDDGYGTYWKSEREILAYHEAESLISTDPKSAHEKFTALIAEGSVMTALTLGSRLCKGDGFKRNVKEGEEWLIKACKNEFCPGLFTLGMFLYGQGRFEEGFSSLLRACEKSYPPALYWTGVLLLTGPKRFRNSGKALDLLTESGRVGHVWSRFAIGMFELRGYWGWKRCLPGLLNALTGLIDLLRIAVDGSQNKLLSSTCI